MTPGCHRALRTLQAPLSRCSRTYRSEQKQRRLHIRQTPVRTREQEHQHIRNQVRKQVRERVRERVCKQERACRRRGARGRCAGRPGGPPGRGTCGVRRPPRCRSRACPSRPRRRARTPLTLTCRSSASARCRRSRESRPCCSRTARSRARPGSAMTARLPALPASRGRGVSARPLG